MVKWLRIATTALALAALLTLAGVVLGRIYAGGLLVELVAGAAVGSVGVSALARRLPNWVVAPLSALLLGSYLILALRIAAARADLATPLPELVTDALTNGIPRLLTAMIPVEPSPDTVVVPVVATWLAGLASAETALRAGRVLLGLVPVGALFAGALYVVGPNAGTAGWPTLVFVGLALALLVTSRRADPSVLAGVPAQTRAMVRSRAIVGTATALVVVLGLIAVVGPWVAKRVVVTPVDPRRYVEPPRVDSLDESPLNRISGWALSPTQRLLEVSTDRVNANSTGKDPAHKSPVNNGASAKPSRVGQTDAGQPKTDSGKPKTVRLRLAVLPDYDGVTWRVGALYRNAGRVLPALAALPDIQISEVHQHITVDGLTGRLLPVVPTATGVSAVRVALDAATGTLIRPEGLTPGLQYSVTSRVQQPDLNLLPTAETPAGDAVARFLTVAPGVPDQIQRLADQLARGNGAPYDRAAAFEEFLADHYRRVADAPSGHAYPNLAFFLFGPRNQGGQVGTSEQFAASFALLARLTGLPSRVVVGFDAPANGGTVTGANAIAWPEILFDGLGWVPFDPMPKNKDPRPVEQDFTPKPTPPPKPPSDAPTQSTAPTSSAPPAAAVPVAAAGPPVVVLVSGVSGSTLLMLVAAAGVVVLARRSLRRRRLTQGLPDDRIVGAWSEFSDALRLAGHPMPAHLAATEAARYAAQPPPAPQGRLRRALPSNPAASAVDEQEPLPPLDKLVAGINTVGFAPGAADDAQAWLASEQVLAYAAALRARRPWWRRVWWSINPGPLRWQRRDR